MQQKSIRVAASARSASLGFWLQVRTYPLLYKASPTAGLCLVRVLRWGWWQNEEPRGSAPFRHPRPASLSCDLNFLGGRSIASHCMVVSWWNDSWSTLPSRFLLLSDSNTQEENERREKPLSPSLRINVRIADEEKPKREQQQNGNDTKIGKKDTTTPSLSLSIGDLVFPGTSGSGKRRPE
jgi:hypothetical protein